MHSANTLSIATRRDKKRKVTQAAANIPNNANHPNNPNNANHSSLVPISAGGGAKSSVGVSDLEQSVLRQSWRLFSKRIVGNFKMKVNPVSVNVPNNVEIAPLPPGNIGNYERLMVPLTSSLLVNRSHAPFEYSTSVPV